MPSDGTLWGSTITVEVSTTAATVDPPTWMDISRYVSYREAGAPLTANGRQTDLTGDEPAQLTLAVRDDDHTFAAGDVLRQGRRIRIREHFGLSTFDLIDAEITQPTVSVPMHIVDGSQAEVTVTVAGTDLLGRLRQARPFISTLAAHIIANGGSALKAYYPMNDATLPLHEAFGRYPTLGVGLDATSTGFVSGRPVAPTANAGTLGADDARVIGPTYTWTGVTITGFQPLHSDWRASPLAVTAAQYVTVVMWVKLDYDITIATLNSSLLPFQVSWDESGGGVGGFRFEPEFAANGSWQVLLSSTSFSSSTGTFKGPVIVPGVAYPIAIQAAFSPDPAHVPHVLEWWVGSTRVVDTSVTGSGVDLSIRDLWAPLRAVNGLMGHLQIYVGDVNAFTFADFQAQYQIGLYGLEGQLTGARVNSILDYAGWASSARDIDPGLARMGVAQLGGKDPLTCLEEARRTEQGRLMSESRFGSRRIRYLDRQRTYNL